LYRQHEIFARLGADIPERTLVGWVNTGSQIDRLSNGQSEV
jgi:hypothetical protein